MKHKIKFLTIILFFIVNGIVSAQSWDQIIKLAASDRQTGDKFGYSVSIDGDYAIVGSYFEDNDASGGGFLFYEAGSAYIFKNNEGTWIQVQKIVASDRNTNDRFGCSVSISGNYAIVGAYQEDEDESNSFNSYLSNSGSVYIFKNNNGIWSQVQKIVADDRAPNDYFGYSVAISGDYVVVGAFQEDEDFNGLGTLLNSGSAYIWKRDFNNSTWIKLKKITASDRGIDDKFGYSVSITNNYIIVGSPFDDAIHSNGVVPQNSGSAYIWKKIGFFGWDFDKKIVSSDRQPGDQFGYSVSIDGEYAIVGAPFQDTDVTGGNNFTNAGSAYIFLQDPHPFFSWEQDEKIVANDRENGDQFGISVSILGSSAIVGAKYEDNDITGGVPRLEAGSAYIIRQNDQDEWELDKKIVANDRASSDNFGSAVAISGNFAIVGAPEEDENASGGSTLLGAGSAYIFDRNATNSGSSLSLKIFLEGPYTSGIMSNLLSVPTSQPYSSLPWSYTGTESVSASFITNTNIVDWILIELRTGSSAANATTVVDTRAALVDKNGNVWDTNGSTNIEFNNAVSGTQYYIAVFHRNHLPVISSSSVSF